jgi:hypothetical protein
LYERHIKGQQSFTVAALAVVCQSVADPSSKMTGPRVCALLDCSKQTAYSHLQRLASMGLIVDGWATDKAREMLADDGAEVVSSWESGGDTYTVTRIRSGAAPVAGNVEAKPVAPSTVVPMPRPPAPVVPVITPEPEGKHGQYAREEDKWAKPGMYSGDDEPGELLWWVDGVEAYVVRRADWPTLEAGARSPDSIEDQLREDGRID